MHSVYKSFFSLTLVGLFALVSAQTAMAQTPTATNTTCQQTYGSRDCPPQHKILLDIQVQSPTTKKYEQNLGPNDPYLPEQPVAVKIDVKNTGTEAVNEAPLATTFPENFSYLTGPGSYDNATRTITLGLDQLQPNETRSFYYTGQLATKLQNPPAMVCNNQFDAEVTYNGATNADVTQFCVKYPTASGTPAPNTGGGSNGNGSGVTLYPKTNAKQTPSTGAEALIAIATLPGAVSGLWLRRKSEKLAATPSSPQA